MRSCLPLVTVLFAGCGNLFNLEHVGSTDFEKRDADVDADPDVGRDADLECYGGTNNGFLTICLDPGVDDPWTFDADIDTGGSSGFDCEMTPTVNGQQLCVIASPAIAITSPVIARGGRPLVLIATQSLSLTTSGTLSVRSALPTLIGAGANALECPGNGPTNGQFSVAGGGGAGGSFVGVGGAGGPSTGVGMAGGTAVAVATPPIDTLRGGCRGGNGGGTTNTGGNSGGAVYLIAGMTISILGTIDASGSGGRGPMSPNGGGGGGSGGMIVLDAPMVTMNAALLLARGGGGGGGGDGVSDGTNGHEPIDDGGHVGIGGLGGGGGGNGGNGSSLLVPKGGNGSTGTTGAGGGGGGGGDGVIRIFSPAFSPGGSTIQPPPS